MILQNQVECLKCGDKPFSRHRHDFRPCKCGAVTVDGGLDYLRRVFNSSRDFRDISIEIEQEVFADLMEAMSDERTNDLGKLCAIARILRDAGYLRLDREEGPSGGHGADVGQASSRVEAGASEGLCP